MYFVAALLVWSIYLSAIAIIFWSGWNTIKRGEWLGQARIGFRRKQAYKVAGNQAVFLGKTYIAASALFLFSIMVPLCAVFPVGKTIAPTLSGAACCIGVFALFLGWIFAITNIEYIEEDEEA